MPTNLTIPRYRCDICETIYEGATALADADHCQDTGLPSTPLPTGTWVVMNGFANMHSLTVGGFRLSRISGHRIRPASNAIDREDHHLLSYLLTAGGTVPRWNDLVPHQRAVLNTIPASFASPSLHGGQLDSALHESPDSADDYARMLHSLGVTMTPEEIQAAARAAYGLNVFGDIQRSRRILPPFNRLSPALQTAFRQVAMPRNDEADPRSGPSLDAEGRSRFAQIHNLVNSLTPNTAKTRARALSGALPDPRRAGLDWFAGRPISITADAIVPAPGQRTSIGDKLTSEQRDSLEAAGLLVRWPPRIRGADSTEINTPKRALAKLLELALQPWEATMTKDLFPVPTKIAVQSGKGGVGKSTISVALARALADLGQRVLLIDLDFHGPSIGTLLSLPALEVDESLEEPRILPAEVDERFHAISVGQFLSADQPVTWRSASVEGFLLFLGARVDTTGYDVIVYDFPPGTGDIEVATYSAARPDTVVLVTTGSSLSHADCARTARFALDRQVPLLGVVENLSRTTVDVDGAAHQVRLFGTESDTEAFTASLHTGAGQDPAPYLGSLPFESDPNALAKSPEFRRIADAALQFCSRESPLRDRPSVAAKD